jgi:hypothetical protein
MGQDAGMKIHNSPVYQLLFTNAIPKEFSSSKNLLDIFPLRLSFPMKIKNNLRSLINLPFTKYG